MAMKVNNNIKKGIAISKTIIYFSVTSHENLSEIYLV